MSLHVDPKRGHVTVHLELGSALIGWAGRKRLERKRPKVADSVATQGNSGAQDGPELLDMRMPVRENGRAPNISSDAVKVPLTSGPRCGHRSPKSGKPCRRAQHHHGRHAFIWQHLEPGRVRETWDSDCQMCGKATPDGAVCRECGA